MTVPGTPAPPATGGAPRRPPVTVIFLVTVTGITANTLVTPAVPDILDGLDAPRGLAGAVVGAGTLPGIVLAPLIGLLADRYGRREVLVPCLLVFGAAGGLIAAAPDLWVLVGLRLVQGAGSAGLINLAVVLIGDHWEGAERARMIGRNAAVLTVSLAVLPPLGGALTDLGGWRAPFLVYPLAVITAVAIATLVPRGERLEVGVREQIGEALPYLRSPAVVATLVGGVMVFVLIFGLFLTVLPLHLEARFGLGASARGLLLGMPALSSTVVALSLGRLTERLGRRAVLVGGGVAFAVAFGVIAGAPVLPVLVAGALLYGLAEGATIPSLQDVAAGAAPAASRGAVVAVWVGGARLGQTVGPLLAGGGLALSDAPTTFVVGAVLAAVLAVGALVGPVDPGATRAGGRPVRSGGTG